MTRRMGRKAALFGCALLSASLLAVPAAAYRLMPAGKAATVANSPLTVTPPNDWNRLGARPGRNAESWTLDGLTLNDLTFYAAIPDGSTLFREVNKTEKPLPRFTKTMLAPDIAQLFEASYRVSLNTSLFTIDGIRPATVAGRPGFAFTYSFVVQNEEVRRRGETAGVIVDGKLYLIAFEAPAIYYFDHDVAAYRQIVASAQFGAPTRP